MVNQIDPRLKHNLGTPKWRVCKENIKKNENRKRIKKLKKDSDVSSHLKKIFSFFRVDFDDEEN